MPRALPIRLEYQQTSTQERVLVSPRVHEQIAELRKFRRSAASPEETLAAILGNPLPMSAVLGMHPDHPLSQHPTHAFILNTLIKRTTAGTSRKPRSLAVRSLDSSVVVVGGPLASRHAAALFGSATERSILGVDLPVGFDLSGVRPGTKAPEIGAKLTVGGKAVAGEYFVLTSLPMGPHKLINISAVTSIGGNSVDLVLGDEKIVHDLFVRAQPFQTSGWQALFRVQSADGRPVAIDRSFDVFEIVGLDFDAEQYPLNRASFLNDYAEVEEKAKIAKRVDYHYNDGVRRDDELTEISDKLADYLRRHPDDKERAQDRLNSILASFTAATRTEDVHRRRKKWSNPKARQGRNPAQFIRDEYGEELKAGTLTRASLHRSDFELSRAYSVWISPKRHPEDDLKLPTRSDVATAEIASLEGLDPEQIKNLHRLAAIARSRHLRSTR